MSVEVPAEAQEPMTHDQAQALVDTLRSALARGLAETLGLTEQEILDRWESREAVAQQDQL